MMQKKVQIISDGSLDLSQELTKEKDIEVVPFYVSFDSETYQKEMVEVGVREFYQEMVDHPTVFPKTSMPSVHDYYEVFEKHAKEQLPVICICITRKFSGSLQSATTAKDMILEEYPDAQITVIDSTVNQKAKYVVPVINPTKSYITNFEGMDIAVDVGLKIIELFYK